MADLPLGDAYAFLQALMRRFGLESLVQWAWDQYAAGRSPTEVELLLEDRQEFKTRFAPIFERRAAGLPPISVEEILGYEAQALEKAHAAGMPAGFVSRELIHRSISANVSVGEFEARVDRAMTTAKQAPPEVRQQLAEFYGVSEGDLAAFWLSPTEGLEAIQRKYLAGSASGQAIRAGFGALTRTEAERLARLDTDDAGFQEAFGELVRSRELFEPLAATEDAFLREEQLGLLEGNAPLEARLEQRRRQRLARFGGGGGYLGSNEGFIGLGSSAT